MQRKAVINIAERIAQLKVIPQQKLPQTLQQQISLPNIKAIHLNYRPMCKNIGLSLQFFRKYSASIRYYNPGLELLKTHSPDGPILMQVLIFRKGAQEPIKINPIQYKSIEEILEKVKSCNAVTDE